jgi:DNA-binding transcriptional regulator YdaS (Cro superfamily)
MTIINPSPTATQRSEGVTLAIQAAGGLSPLARKLGMSQQALSEWRRIPADRILQVEAVTGIARERLRPELYRSNDHDRRRVRRR